MGSVREPPKLTPYPLSRLRVVLEPWEGSPLGRLLTSKFSVRMPYFRLMTMAPMPWTMLPAPTKASFTSWTLLLTSSSTTP